MHFTIAVLGPRVWFADIALPCRYALAELGWQADIRVNELSAESVNIVFGAHTLAAGVELPPGSIVYNFEQVSSGYFTAAYVNRLRAAAAVWDYSPANIAALRDRWGIEARHVFPGYVREMSCLTDSLPQDIDVLFYGTPHGRRKAVLEAMRARGLNVLELQAFGPQRDYAICRAALLLNVHYYLPASLEVARLGFLWANRKAVLSEDCPEHGLPTGLEEACCYLPYDQLADAAVALTRKPAWRRQVAERGFEAYRRLPLAEILRQVVGRHAPGRGLPLPDTLNAGSGKSFRRDCLNVDISPQWNPDIVADLSLPLEADAVFSTARFGDVRLKPGMFRRVVVHDVLEHVRDLKRMMENFLWLLEDGGVLDVSVPYDLSLGAWQDPTHVRAFNENSWKYYTEWHWYLGWREHRFDLAEMFLVLSPLGAELARQGVDEAGLLRTPRAVDALRVQLRKRATSQAEKMLCDIHARSFYAPGAGNWEL